MAIIRITGLRSALSRMQWRRGLRAALAVGVAMFVCYLLGKPLGWAALGAFQVIVVDNGGPYRSRLANILTILIGGSLGVFAGLLAGVNLPIAVTATFLFCFAATLARVMSQPFASSSVTVLVSYIVAVGTPPHTLAYAATSTLYFTLGALWAASLSLLLWPADPFRPARIAVANVYASLADLIRLLPSTTEPAGRSAFNESLNLFRLRTETAQQTLAATPARMTSRTIRARSLTVLTENADLLLARLLRIAELGSHDPRHPLPEIAGWLTASLEPIEPALRQRPRDRGASFAPTGFLYTNLQRTLPRLEAALLTPEQPSTHLIAALRDTLLYFETTYEAIRAIWTGIEPRRSPITLLDTPILTTNPHPPLLWFDALQANLSLRSVMFRHALRLGFIVAFDVLIAGLIHIHHQPITHSYWIAMTSLIVLQPYTGETIRRSGERVLGTVAGAALASLLAVFIHTEVSLLLTVSIGAFFTLALYAVDYAWFCFFLTPTIVLMVLPHFRDWHFAAVRMGMTGFGALTAVLAMLFLWPELESLQLPRLLARCTQADAAYLRAMLAFWNAAATSTDAPSHDTQSHDAARIHAERTLLAPARRLCGLAANQAEETLDHALLEPDLPLIGSRDRAAQLSRSALTFTTFVRRLTQTITTVAAIGTPTPSAMDRISQLATRLDAVSTALEAHTLPPPPPASPSSPDEQLVRIERQVSVLERTAVELTAAISSP